MNNSKATYSAFDTALYYITFKDRTQKEISAKLRERGYSDSDIEEALDKLKEYRYINEENYALSYIRSNISKKGEGLIVRELLKKGISRDVIERQFSYFDEAEEDVVRNMFETRYADVDLSDECVIRKIYGYFQRRGFRYETISHTLSFYRKNTKNY